MHISTSVLKPYVHKLSIIIKFKLERREMPGSHQPTPTFGGVSYRDFGFFQTDPV